MHWSSSWHPRGLDPRNPMGAVTILQPHLRVFKLERITDPAATLGLQPSAGQRGAIAGAPRSIMGASALSFALVTSECMSRVPASGRADGSLTSAAATKEASTSPHSGDSEGGGPLTMANMMSNTDESSEFGGFIVASSMAVMPTPHTSTCRGKQGESSSISGCALVRTLPCPPSRAKCVRRRHPGAHLIIVCRDVDGGDRTKGLWGHPVWGTNHRAAHLHCVVHLRSAGGRGSAALGMRASCGCAASSVMDPVAPARPLRGRQA